MKGTLVWLRGQKGPYLEKRSADMPINGKLTEDILSQHPLNDDEYPLKLSILEQRYPPPKDWQQ